MSATCPAPVRSPLSSATKRSDKSTNAQRVGRVLSFKSKSKKPTKSKKQRKSRVLFHYTKEELEPFFDISQREAAKRLGIAVITLKRICKRGKFNWPYRANKSKEIQERNQRISSASRSPPANIRTMKTRRDTAQAPCKSAHFAYENQSVGDDMCHALRSLAMCAFKLEEQESQGTRATSSAAMAFSRLPLVCMLENDTTIEL